MTTERNNGWRYDRRLHFFIRSPGVYGDPETAVPVEGFFDSTYARSLYGSWGLTEEVARWLCPVHGGVVVTA